MELRMNDKGMVPSPVDGISASGRCAICARRRAAILLHAETCAPEIDADGVVETPLAAPTWTLCAQCAAAVRYEMTRAALHSPLRLSIALAVVASERGPAAHPPIWCVRYWQYADARTQDKWMTRLIVALFAWPLIAFMGLGVLPVLLR